MDNWSAIAAERRALADVLDSLTPEQWATRSLCEAWTVREVAAHLLVGPTIGLPRFLLAMGKARGNFDRASEAITAGFAQRPTETLVAELRSIADSHWTPPMMGSVAPLTDVLVHSMDIRIPLEIADDRPVEPWRPVLDFLVSPKARRGFVGKELPRLQYATTDLDWSHGSGDEVRGPAVALALTLLGRPARAGELSGPGLATLTGALGK